MLRLGILFGEEKPLFDEEIHAWANGPVCPNLYLYHKENFHIQRIRGANSEALSSDERESVDAVLDHYVDFTGQQLSALTHEEPPCSKRGEDSLPQEQKKALLLTSLCQSIMGQSGVASSNDFLGRWI